MACSLFILSFILWSSVFAIFVHIFVVIHISTAFSGHFSASILHISKVVYGACLNSSMLNNVLLSFQYADFLLCWPLLMLLISMYTAK